MTIPAPSSPLPAPRPLSDPESDPGTDDLSTCGAAFLFLFAVLFALLVAWSEASAAWRKVLGRVHFWLTTKRVCCYCPRPHWIGGNPFARRLSHGICPTAFTHHTSLITPKSPTSH